jgi:cysteine synthase A
MKGAIEKASELHQEIKNSWIPQQFENEANVKIHIETTAQEILRDFPNGIDYLITGVGTGGHITGVAKVVKEKFPNMKAFAVEPELSPVLSGGQPGPHPIQGIGAGFVPKILKTDLLDGIIQVSKDEAFEYMKKIAKTEGILVGISTGASLAAVAKKLPEIPENSTILTFNYDTGERYISNEELFENV